MPFKFNIFTGNLDVVNAPPDQYIDGEVEYHSSLPVTVGTPAVNSAFLVRKGEGLYFISRKPAGIWVRELNNGNLDDWKFAGTFSDLYRDANFRIISDSDTSKELAFSLSGVTSGQTRTLSVPDKSGVVATTSDLPDDYTVVTAAGNLANGDRVAVDTTSAAFTLTLPASPANGDTIYVLDYAGTFASNNLTIGRNGNNIESLAEDLVCNVEKAAFSLVYAGSTVGWKVVPQTAQMPSTSLANTWQVNQTFNGTNNTAPNQTAASGSSLMTRDLTDDAIFRRWNRWAIYENFNFKTAELTTIGGTASPSNTTGAADMPGWVYRPSNTVDAANNYQAINGVYVQLSPVTSRAIKNWSKRSVLALRHLHIASGGTTRYYWGPPASTWAGGALAVRGIGFEIVNNSLVATCHNGTSKTTASSGVTLSNQILYNLLIESDGAGGVRWYVDGAEQTALTGGPTGNSAGNSQFGFCTEAVNPTPAAGTFVAIHNLMLASAL